MSLPAVATKEGKRHVSSNLLDSPCASDSRGDLHFLNRRAIYLKDDTLGVIEYEGHRMFYYIKRRKYGYK